MQRAMMDCARDFLRIGIVRLAYSEIDRVRPARDFDCGVWRAIELDSITCYIGIVSTLR